ncbi:MAG: hypothetical protein WC820_07100 [Spirochaetales bacterium]|jgi:hypothetical protein
MSISEYLDSSPFFDIVKYGNHAALDAIAFIGTLKKHPYDPNKCLLLTAQQEKLKWLDEGIIIEFRVADVLAADELPSPVDELGTARPLVRLWVKRGAIALRYDPFEVGDKFLGPRESMALRTKLAQLLQIRAEKR